MLLRCLQRKRHRLGRAVKIRTASSLGSVFHVQFARKETYHGYQEHQEDDCEDEVHEEAGCPQCQEREEAGLQEGLSVVDEARPAKSLAGFRVFRIP